MREVGFEKVTINNGFWAEQQKINKDVTAGAVYERFSESGRFKAASYEWKEGEPGKPHIFWDSDIAKWIEGISYILVKKRDERLEAIIDHVVEAIERNRREDGYFNSYFLAADPDHVLQNRMDHELYCLGHYIEAALAYKKATGKDKLLLLSEEYVELADRIFKQEHSGGFDTPGHEEIELALGKLYKATGKEEYKKLLVYFLNTRGRSSRDDSFMPLYYTQSHLPVTEQREVTGHAVRALYLYCGMMELFEINEDKAMLDSCKELFCDITDHKLYLTGGIGSTHAGEAFTYSYDLPDTTAYAETCASIALAMFCRHLWKAETDTRYDDIAELAIYNTVLAGISLSGDEFFYENPLKVDYRRSLYYSDKLDNLKERLPIYRRVKLFDCSCCPPNLLRFISFIGDYMYTIKENTVYTHLYMGAEVQMEVNGNTFILRQETEYPFKDQITIKISGQGSFCLALRIPGWCRSPQLKINGAAVKFVIDSNGYIMAEGCTDKTVIEIRLPMVPRLVEASPQVTSCCGRTAVMRGPVVYCAEGIDQKNENLFDLSLPENPLWEEAEINISGRTFIVLHTQAYAREADGQRAPLYAPAANRYRTVPMTLIPYFTWANREACDMSVWLLKHF